jgi:GDP/UDP-N,N'-diacetylbacillosamine 2-epimerase (hydrolysing)
MNIGIFTASRSEYGLLKILIQKLNFNKKIKIDLIVSGSHLSKKYGYSIDEIKKDKIKITKKIYVNLKNDTNWGIGNAFADTSKKINNFLKLKNYDLIILLGDRYETLAIAILAYINRIPIAHIHGGEKTFNSLDDNYRHSISKLSTLHFVSHISNKKRLLQLGEKKKNIYVVGGLGACQIKKIKLFEKKYLEKELNTKLSENFIIINVYNEIYNQRRIIKNLLRLFKIVKKNKNITFISTLPSHEINSKYLNNKIKNFSRSVSNFRVFKNLGQKKYYSLIKFSSLMIGNSSSGILEAPSFGIYTINIGTRQKGRIFSKSIIQSDYEDKQLENKILKHLNKKHKFQNPYFKKNTYDKIVNVIIKLKKKNLEYKEFVDL